jgi:hypothetical protein
MSTPEPTPARAVRDELAAALRALATEDSDDAVRYYEIGDSVDPPGVLLSLPSLRWDSVCSDPTSATFSIMLVAGMNDRAIEYLLDNYPTVVEACESVVDVTVTAANPSIWRVGNTDLPSFEITAEVAL